MTTLINVDDQTRRRVSSLTLYVDNSAGTTTGTNTSTTANKLVDSGASFLSNVKPNQVVINTSDSTSSVVDYVESDTTVVLKDNIFTS
jgi:hypothetical protein